MWTYSNGSGHHGCQHKNHCILCTCTFEPQNKTLKALKGMYSYWAQELFVLCHVRDADGAWQGGVRRAYM